MGIYNVSILLNFFKKKQVELAKILGVSRPIAIDLENGRRSLSESEKEILINEFNLDPYFFDLNIKDYSSFNRAKVSTLKKSDLEAIKSIGKIFLSANRTELKIDISKFKNQNPQEVVLKLKQLLDINTDNPIDNLVKIIQDDIGLNIYKYDFKTDLIDGYTLYNLQNTEFAIFQNKNTTNDRQRFTLAHELGHVLLHNEESFIEKTLKEIEDEATQFASHFLLTDYALKNIFKEYVGLKQLAEAKKKYKVSMASILYSAKKRGFVEDYIFNKIFYKDLLQFRKVEPIELQEEVIDCDRYDQDNIHFLNSLMASLKAKS